MRQIDIAPRYHRVPAAIAAVAVAACARQVRHVQLTPDAPAVISELWQAPREPRDLFHGPGGEGSVPREQTFTFVAEDTTGWSPGFDVRDDSGVEWSVKTGPGSAIRSGYVAYLVGNRISSTADVLSGELVVEGRAHRYTGGGRFRPRRARPRGVGDWPWHENPFVGTPEFGGLVVANLLLTSWDWKTSNNKIYQLDKPVNGVTAGSWCAISARRSAEFTYPTLLKWFRLRGFGQGTRNDLPGFEEQGFIRRIDDGDVEFELQGHLPRRHFDGDDRNSSAGRASGCRSCRIGNGTMRFARRIQRRTDGSVHRLRSRRRSPRVCK